VFCAGTPSRSCSSSRARTRGENKTTPFLELLRHFVAKTPNIICQDIAKISLRHSQDRLGTNIGGGGGKTKNERLASRSTNAVDAATYLKHLLLTMQFEAVPEVQKTHIHLSFAMMPFYENAENDHQFTKTGSGQTDWESSTLSKTRGVTRFLVGG
jgi:hypothetical protein